MHPVKHNLPRPPFLYTLDQIASLLNLGLDDLKRKYIFFEGQTAGLRGKKMRAVALDPEAPQGQRDWRVQDAEFLSWLRRTGFRVQE